MAQKVVGYREMAWTCAACGAKNPGSVRTCRSCGAAMSEDIKFEQQTNADMIKDEKVIEKASQGPDIYCAYCGNRNPAGAKSCSRCGADLSEGKERSHGSQHSAHIHTKPTAATVVCPACGTKNYADSLKCITCGSPLNSTQAKEEIPSNPQPVNTESKGGKGPGCLVFIIILIGLGIAIAALLLFGGGGSGITVPNITPVPNTVLDAVVSSQTWQTSVQVIGPIESSGSAWRDQVPAGARNLKCSDRVRYRSDDEKPNSVEICGTPYAIDLGNGYEQFVQDCVYDVYDSYCEYTIEKTGVINTARASGSGPNPESPYVDSRYSTGSQSVTYTVQLIDENGKTYTLNPSSLTEYRSYPVGTEFTIEVNNRGRIVNMEMK